MDDSMLLPLDVREEAFLAEANILDVMVSMHESGNYPGLSDEQLERRANRDINAVLKQSQCYVCSFAKQKRVAFFWFTPVIASRYLTLRDSLTQLNDKTKMNTGQEIAEVALTPVYSHSSPLNGSQQTELVQRFSDKVHAFWIRASEMQYQLDGDSTRQAFHFDTEDRLDLRWYPIPMSDGTALDEIYNHLKREGMFVNVEPYAMPPAVLPFPPNARNVTDAQRLERQRQHVAYMYAQGALSHFNVVRNPPEATVSGGLLEVTVTATGLVCNRADYPQARTPILTWKQIRKAIPKAQRKQQREPGHPLVAKRRRVIMQRKEDYEL